MEALLVGRIKKHDGALDTLVEELLDLRVKLSLAIEAKRRDDVAITTMLEDLSKLEAAISKRRQIP